jgi:hypothetical protein
LVRRRPTSGLIFHSDRGSQYASGDFQKQLSAFGMRGSMSRRGNCWDNAVTETLFASIKVERLHGMRFASRRQAEDEVIDWLGFYNHRRLHSTLGYLSPMAFEKKWLADKKGWRHNRSAKGDAKRGQGQPCPCGQHQRSVPHQSFRSSWSASALEESGPAHLIVCNT